MTPVTLWTKTGVFVALALLVAPLVMGSTAAYGELLALAGLGLLVHVYRKHTRRPVS